ncbi:methionyl-tRNA formyltransferase, mitochondrial-like [Mya arenaria]|uniref:methionyl-tRNA formyltransferase, mitochondrial-like n=1 Tax=Mya arenaria TaxID=6604 RepID=UPI0022E98F49|nr:methionyl-tRNA formyltransferase, mitochondrial-like [Mya arenaria]
MIMFGHLGIRFIPKLQGTRNFCSQSKLSFGSFTNLDYSNCTIIKFVTSNAECHERMFKVMCMEELQKRDWLFFQKRNEGGLNSNVSKHKAELLNNSGQFSKDGQKLKNIGHKCITPEQNNSNMPLSTIRPLNYCRMASSRNTFSQFGRVLHGQIDFISKPQTLSKMIHTFVISQLATFEDMHRGTVFTKKEPPWRIKFFGTDTISLETLAKLHNNMTTTGSVVESLDVVTVPGPVEEFAADHGLPVEEWPIPIENQKYDVGVLVSFGHLIPENIINMFPYGILNMHPSLLPRWRGASPIVHTILNNDEVSGISIMEIRPKHFDIGPLLMQQQVLVPHRSTSPELSDLLSHFGASVMLRCLKNLPVMERFEHEQEKYGVTYAHKIKLNNSHIDWHNQTAIEVDCQYRAIGDQFPLKTELDGQPMKLQNVVDPYLLKDVGGKGYLGKLPTSEPGTVGYSKQHGCIVVKCKVGLVGFETVIVKKKLTAQSFYNGYLNKRDHVQFSSLPNNLNRYTSLEKIPMQNQM